MFRLEHPIRAYVSINIDSLGGVNGSPCANTDAIYEPSNANTDFKERLSTSVTFVTVDFSMLLFPRVKT